MILALFAVAAAASQPQSSDASRFPAGGKVTCRRVLDHGALPGTRMMRKCLNEAQWAKWQRAADSFPGGHMTPSNSGRVGGPPIRIQSGQPVR